MSGVRCINNCKRLILSLLVCGAVLMTGCASAPGMSFQNNSNLSNFNFLVGESGNAETAKPFAGNLCVVKGNGSENTDSLEDMAKETSAALFDLNDTTTIYAKDVYKRVYPASLTKIMTALVALENASSDKVLTASGNVYMTDADAQKAGLEKGDTMTLDQALHIMLIYSANDVAIMIAENIGGTVENFINMMNDEAKRLGATQTNFINSNGLSDENHYTTAYDMYLIFNQALQFSTFNEIINMPNYTTVYHDQNGAEKEITVNSTNMYLQSVQAPPTGVTVVGGKTGTTTAAGHCLVLLARDTSGRPYIAIVMKSWDEDKLYSEMNQVLSLIPKG